MKLDPEYVSCVLNDNFEDAKSLFLDLLLEIDRAHLVMLVEQGIVSPGDGRAIRDALNTVNLEDIRRVVYDGTYEDLFFFIERQLIAGCGVDVAGRLHTARSRNDIDMTLSRMRQREFLPTSRKVPSVLERIALHFVDPQIVLDGGPKWQKLYGEVLRGVRR